MCSGTGRGGGAWGGGLLGSIVQEFRGLCFFCSAGTLRYNKKKIWGAPRQPVIF